MKAKTYLKMAKMLGIMMIIFASMNSCKKSNSENSPKSIYSTISSDSQYSIFGCCNKKEGLVSALDGKGALTLFAPNNSAFAAAGIKSEADLALIPADSTLKKHFIVPCTGKQSQFVTNSSGK